MDAVNILRWNTRQVLIVSAGLMLFVLSLIVSNTWIQNEALGIFGIGLFILGLGSWKKSDLKNNNIREYTYPNDKLTRNNEYEVSDIIKISGFFIMVLGVLVWLKIIKF